MTTTITTTDSPAPETTTEAAAETLRLAEEAGRASATADAAATDAAEAQRTAEAAASAASAAMAGQIVTVDMMTAQAGEIATLRQEVQTLAALVAEMVSDDDGDVEGTVTEVEPVPQPADLKAEKPKDATGMLGRMIFR